MAGALTISAVNALLAAGGLDPDASAEAILGNVVQRPTAALPQSAQGDLYTITGGRIIVTEILGEVTTVIQTQANNAKLVHNPTAAGSDVDLCAVLNISAKALATLFGISGVFADAMNSGLAIPGQSQFVVCQIGTIALNCSASNTGNVKWTLRYIPLDVGARVVAA